MTSLNKDIVPLHYSAIPTPEDEAILALLLQIVTSLVPRGSKVSVDITNGSNLSTVSVRASPEDIGRLVGEQGRIVKSIRTILTAAAMTFERRYALDIKATD